MCPTNQLVRDKNLLKDKIDVEFSSENVDSNSTNNSDSNSDDKKKSDSKTDKDKSD